MRTWSLLALLLLAPLAVAHSPEVLLPSEDASASIQAPSHPREIAGKAPKVPPAPKPGASGGPGAGKRFSKDVKDAAEDQAGGKCVFCGTPTTQTPGPNQRNTDHAIPKSRDGNNTLDNAQNTCRSCNLEKGAKTTEEHLQGK